jgi:GTP-binding protein
MSANLSVERLRNIAIVAHVDHGKTTLVDQLLKQSGTLNERAAAARADHGQQRPGAERGITILSKNTAIRWNDGGRWRINIVDTPGHADFGGEVERVLSMVDSVLILVDAMDGPMPQTRFVTQKAFAMGFKPIVVINKVDRPAPARTGCWTRPSTCSTASAPATSSSTSHRLRLGAHGYAGLRDDVREGDMTPLFETIIKHVAPPPVDVDGPFQMRVTSLDYNNYVGIIGIGRDAARHGAHQPAGHGA